MIEFLVILALIWLVIASINDIKKREVPNWLSFSLIIFALGYRAFYSAFSSDWMFFVYGLLGFAVFYLLACLFYYGRIFAGGDAKLLMGLGAILPFGNSIYGNLLTFLIFIFLLFLAGGFYGLLYSFVLVLKNKRRFVKEFRKQLKFRKNLFFVGLISAVLSLGFFIYLSNPILLILPLLMFIFPYLFIYAKSVEESCMIKEVKGREVTVGDWLYEEVRIGKKRIKPYWEGLDEKEVRLLKRVRKVKIKQGIPFVPAFLIAFILFLLFKDYFLNFLLI